MRYSGSLVRREFQPLLKAHKSCFVCLQALKKGRVEAIWSLLRTEICEMLVVAGVGKLDQAVLEDALIMKRRIWRKGQGLWQ